MSAQIQGIPLVHQLHPAFQLHLKKLPDHGQSALVYNQRGLGVHQRRLPQCGGVVGLHVIDHDIIQLPARQRVGQVFQKLFRNGLVHRVQQGGLFPPEQIGVVGYSLRNGIYAFKKRQTAIVCADINQISGNFASAMHGYFPPMSILIFLSTRFRLSTQKKGNLTYLRKIGFNRRATSAARAIFAASGRINGNTHQPSAVQRPMAPVFLV